MARRRRTFSSCYCSSAILSVDLVCFEERTSSNFFNFAQNRRRRFTDLKSGVSLVASDADRLRTLSSIPNASVGSLSEPSDLKLNGESMVMVAKAPGSFQIWRACSPTSVFLLSVVDRDLFSVYNRSSTHHSLPSAAVSTAWTISHHALHSHDARISLGFQIELVTGGPVAGWFRLAWSSGSGSTVLLLVAGWFHRGSLFPRSTILHRLSNRSTASPPLVVCVALPTPSATQKNQVPLVSTETVFSVSRRHGAPGSELGQILLIEMESLISCWAWPINYFSMSNFVGLFGSWPIWKLYLGCPNLLIVHVHLPSEELKCRHLLQLVPPSLLVSATITSVRVGDYTKERSLRSSSCLQERVISRPRYQNSFCRARRDRFYHPPPQRRELFHPCPCFRGSCAVALVLRGQPSNWKDALQRLCSLLSSKALQFGALSPLLW